MNLDALHQLALRFMVGYYRDHDELPTTFFAIDRQQCLHLLGVPLYPNKRDLYESFLPAYFLHHGVTAYGTAAEGWMALDKLTPAEPPPCEAIGRSLFMQEGKPSPSSRPDRVEVLISSAVDRHEARQLILKIERQPGKRPRLGEPIANESGGIMARAGVAGLLLDPEELAPGAAEAIDEMVPLVTPRFIPIRKIIPRAEYERWGS